MRHVLLGMFCGVVLTAIVWQLNDQAHGQSARAFRNDPSGGMLVVPLAGHKTAQNLAVVDTQSRVIGIYAVDSANGGVVPGLEALFAEGELRRHQRDADIPPAKIVLQFRFDTQPVHYE